ncbi:MAG TPA: sigma 54-interacting transcriptional regulator [Polyangiaceae bacterium]|nr:sigma 54-interacting transcriptional regulator [Polyangiaceae bacterium]
MTDFSRFPKNATTNESVPPTGARSDTARDFALGVVHSPDPALAGHSQALGGSTLVVGRDVDAPGLCIADSELSRLHYRVVFDGRAVRHRIGDAGSRNGTFVRGRRIDSALLEAGDVVRAGSTVFVYGDSDPMIRLMADVERVQTGTLAVLVLGETGVGKERVARALHDGSGREGDFVAVNCAAFSRDLLAAELFGHTRGAFSGATQARRGLFQTAHRGSLFLDEVGDLPLELQAALLRVIEDGQVRAVGSDNSVVVDVRIVSATHADLEQRVRSGQFRADLFARLGQVVLRVPPLRERRAQVLSFASQFAREAGQDRLELTADAAEALVKWDWPLNIRELRSLILGFSAMGQGSLDFDYLDEHHAELLVDFRHGPTPEGRELEGPAPRDDRRALEARLRRHAGNVSAVAEELGKPRAQVYRWLRAAGLVPSRYRSDST